MAPIIIVVTPSGKPGRFQATLADTGELVVRSSREPMCASARVLVARGLDPGVELIMKHTGSDVVALRAQLGVAARLRVHEGMTRFVPWAADPRFRVPPPVDETQPAATPAAPTERPTP